MRILKKILIGSRNLLLFLFVSSLLAVVAYKFIPVYYTPLMFIRVYEQVRDSKSIKLEHKWMPLKQIAQPLAQAVVASEDNLFLDHDGFDMIQIQKARADAEKRQTCTRSEHYLATDCQERVSLARKDLFAQRHRGLFHRPDRMDLGERTYHGSLSELDRNGRRYLWC